MALVDIWEAWWQEKPGPYWRNMKWGVMVKTLGEPLLGSFSHDSTSPGSSGDSLEEKHVRSPWFLHVSQLPSFLGSQAADGRLQGDTTCC